jgi:predicted P-loop ATPase
MTTTVNPSEKKSVTDYLNALVWDGTPRIDRWLIDCAGAEDTDAVRAASRAMLVTAVRRARHPGCRVDLMPVIEGPQGSGKSRALRLLAVDEDWYTDAAPISTDDTRRIMEATAGKWIVEAAELSNMKPSVSASLKSYLSRSSDKARMAYQRDQTLVPRAFTIIGTTGSPDYLRDTTGSRRFWPVTVRGFDLERLAAVRDQLWAEASFAEAAGESIVPPAQSDLSLSPANATS